MTHEQSDASAPLRIALVGAGVMGRTWIRQLTATDDVELAAVIDLDQSLAESAVADAGLTGVTIAPDVTTASAVTALDAVVNVTVPQAHHPVSTEALYLGLPVLCEKPIAPTVAQALSLAAASEHTGHLLMVGQSRRYGPDVSAFRSLIGGIGGAGTVTTEFFLAPHFGGFREQMEHVLLVDMAIHHFDAMRYLLDDEPVAVYCHESNPAWSWYAGASTATAVFELASGATYSYAGSWCADGFGTSWNGSWRANGPDGTALWDGDSPPTVDYRDGVAEKRVDAGAGPAGIAGALQDFVAALRTGVVPGSEIHSNILSLAMCEAAVESAVTGERVAIGSVIERARAAAQESETRPELVPLIAELRVGAPAR